MTTTNALREAIIKLLYEEAPDTPWLTDAFYDKLIALIENEYQKREMDKVNEVLGTLRSTAKGALVASERDKNAMKKAMEAIGLLHSLVLAKEIHSSKSEQIVLEAVGLLHDAMKFKSEEPKNGAALGAIAGTSS